MLSKYQKPRAVRREGRTLAGRFRGGRLAPVMAVPFRESESGVLSQSIVYELDPIPGRMITPITAEIVCVYVPALAIDALMYPDEDFAGSADVFRQKLLAGAAVFPLENESAISKRLGIEPRSIAGEKKVNRAGRVAYAAAWNYLARRKYVKAHQYDKNNGNVLPALLGQTVLDRLNAVLDPEDRVNGKVDLTGDIPVKGIGRLNGAPAADNFGIRVDETAPGSDVAYPYAASTSSDHASDNMWVRLDNTGRPQIYADLGGAADVSLSDFYTAERMDALTREMRQLVDRNPEYGEELVRRFAHGLSVEVGQQPFILYQGERTFGTSTVRAMDGANLDVTQTNSVVQMDFTVPVPATEFGGIVITMAAVKPDETLAHQPHPILSHPWGAINYVADEMAIDPVPVTIRDLYADCAPEDENTVACYVGNNHLKRNYVNYGFNRHLDTSTVEAKTAIWQIAIPMSVTPDSVAYPTDLSQYPFVDQNAEICQYTVSSTARINTPIIFGPTPVEELAEIETADLFDDAE